MKNAIFMSGPHGSGKTTLINRLVSEHNIFQENDFEIDFTQEFLSIKTMNHFECCLLRLYHRLFARSHADELAQNNLDKVIISSRSVYDSAAYVKSYQEMGWLTPGQMDRMNFILGHSEPVPYTIILNPPADVVKSRLEKRHALGSRKLRDKIFSYEDTVEFVESMSLSFAAFKGHKNVLYIEDNGDEEINAIVEWVKNLSPIPSFLNNELGDEACLQAAI